MTQAMFEVQIFDGHGWVTRHRGADVDAAGEAARMALPEARKRAVRIVKQSYDTARQQLDHQVVFSLGKARGRTVRRTFGVAAALALSAAAIAAAAVMPSLDPAALFATTETGIVAETDAPAPVPAQPLPESPTLSTLTPAAGRMALQGANAFDCEGEAATGMVRASNIPPARDRLYVLCARALTGDAPAQVDLAMQLAAGEGASADPAQAVRWLQEAARADHVPAFRPLGDLLMGAGGDPARAVAWYHRAATHGDTAAARMLGERYRAGDGVAADPRIALSYELMAAEAGDTTAMLRAGEAFRTGEGTETNPEAARRWLERAAAAGEPQAVAALAALPDTPALQWTLPADQDGPDRSGQVQATWNPPAADVLSVPLHLEIDGDATESYTSFAGATAHASV